MLGTEEITIEHNPTSPDSIGVDPLEPNAIQVNNYNRYNNNYNNSPYNTTFSSDLLRAPSGNNC